MDLAGRVWGISVSQESPGQMAPRKPTSRVRIDCSSAFAWRGEQASDGDGGWTLTPTEVARWSSSCQPLGESMLSIADRLSTDLPPEHALGCLSEVCRVGDHLPWMKPI